MIEMLTNLRLFTENTLDLFFETAPWLLLGLVLAGIMKSLMEEDKIKRWIGGEGAWPIVKAAVIGAPLPLCSCGVVPVAMGMRKGGASKGSTISFMLSTPENGVDSVSLTYVLLGPVMAIIRPISGITLGIFAGLLTGWKDSEPDEVKQEVKTCCSGKHDHATTAVSHKAPLAHRIQEGLIYAFTSMVDDLRKWLIIGLLAAGAVVTFVPTEFLTQWGSGPLAMLVMIVAGVPMYICASSSTPLAVSFAVAGLSPGTVLVFLLAGPATNIGTLGIINREFGRRALWSYLTAIVLGSISLGLLTDELYTYFNLSLVGQSGELSHLHLMWYHYVTGAIMLVLFTPKIRAPFIGGLQKFKTATA